MGGHHHPEIKRVIPMSYKRRWQDKTGPTDRQIDRQKRSCSQTSIDSNRQTDKTMLTDIHG